MKQRGKKNKIKKLRFNGDTYPAQNLKKLFQQTLKELCNALYNLLIKKGC